MICVDASVAAKWLFPEEYSARALTLVDHAAAARERIIAPTLLPIEIANIIRQRMRQGTLTLDQAQDELSRLGPGACLNTVWQARLPTPRLALSVHVLLCIDPAR